MILRSAILALSLIAAPVAVQAQAELAVETARVEDLTSIRQIKHMQALWGYSAMAGQWQDMADLVTLDATVRAPEGEMTGRAAIADWLRNTQGNGQDGMPAGRMNIRLFISPVIALSEDGQSATGRWHEISMTADYGVTADWAGGTWEIDYSKTDSGWRISAMDYYAQFAGPYGGGWSHDALTLVRAPYRYTPDQVGRILPNREAAQPRGREELTHKADLLLQMSRMQNVVSAFGYYLDRGMYDDIADLFFSNGGIYEDGFGGFYGQESIHRYLERFGVPGLDEGELNDRPQLMPLVSISEGGVLGNVHTVEIGTTGQHGGSGYWSVTINTFLLQRGPDDIWRIVLVSREPLMRADYAEGWALPLPAMMPVPGEIRPDKPANEGPGGYPLTAIAALSPQSRSFTVEAHSDEVAPTADPDALAKAEAFDGAENVSNAYGYYIDQFAWRNTAALFAQDGWKELSYIGTFIGNDRVLGSLIQRYGEGGPNDAFQAIHQKTQPYVTPSEDGQRAQIRTRLWQFNSSTEPGGSWIGGIYENQIVKEDGIWRIHGMDLDYVWLADVATGWMGADPEGSARFGVSEEVIAQFAPDAPLRGEVFAPYPRIAPMGFHFANPVSGREPELHLQWSDGRRSGPVSP